MAKPKKDKYIRDLFEEDFYKKFFEFICSANKDVLVKNYFENRKNVFYALTKHRYFQDIPIIGFKILEENEIFTVQKFIKILFMIEFRDLLYKQYELINLLKQVSNKVEVIEKIANIVIKSFNKSINKFVEKNSNEFYIFQPSRSSIVITVLLNIFDDINSILKQNINPNKRKRIEANIEKRNTFLVSEYQFITKIYQAYKKVNNLSEDEIRFYISQKLDYDPMDDRISYVIENYNSTISKKNLAILYLKERYNLSGNIETIDKTLDRGRKKRIALEENMLSIIEIDSHLVKINAYRLEIATPKELEFDIYWFKKHLSEIIKQKNQA